MLNNNALNILIVEDDNLYTSKLKSWLKPSAKSIESVETAEQGRSLVISSQPDIIFIDNILPEMKGSEMIKTYKTKSPNSSIILMSGVFSLKDISESIECGADFIIDKNDTDKEGFENLLKVIKNAKAQNESIWRLWEFFNKKKKTLDYKNIAIVEDDELFSFHLSWILDKAGNNLKINSFSNAENFYKYCEKSCPDVLFLDYYLPDKNGDEVLKFIKKKNPDVHVVMISIQESPVIALELNKLGIANYIIKDKDWKKNTKDLIDKLGLS